MPDILVESFDVDVGASGSTHTLTNDVGSTSSAFVKINNSSDKSSAGPTGSTANANANVVHVATRLTDTDELTFTRNVSTTVKVVGEVWRYTGSAGGANEFINRGTYAITVSGTSASTAVSGISNEDNCVPFLVGVDTSSASVSDYETATFAVHMDGSGNVVASRGNSGTTATVYVNVVEFTGSNWSIGHGVSSSHDTANETITLNTDSTGTGGSTFDVGDWETAFIEATGGGDSTETGLADIMFTVYPAGTTQAVVSYQEGDANARNDSSAYVHVMQNDDLIVKRASNTNVTEGNGTYGTVSWPTGASTARNLDELALEWFCSTSGTGTAHKRGSLGTRITDATGTITHWVHRSGNTVDARYAVIDLSQLEDTGGGSTTVTGAEGVITPIADSGSVTATSTIAGNEVVVQSFADSGSVVTSSIIVGAEGVIESYSDNGVLTSTTAVVGTEGVLIAVADNGDITSTAVVVGNKGVITPIADNGTIEGVATTTVQGDEGVITSIADTGSVEQTTDLSPDEGYIVATSDEGSVSSVTSLQGAKGILLSFSDTGVVTSISVIAPSEAAIEPHADGATITQTSTVTGQEGVITPFADNGLVVQESGETNISGNTTAGFYVDDLGNPHLQVLYNNGWFINQESQRVTPVTGNIWNVETDTRYLIELKSRIDPKGIIKGIADNGQVISTSIIAGTEGVIISTADEATITTTNPIVGNIGTIIPIADNGSVVQTTELVSSEGIITGISDGGAVVSTSVITPNEGVIEAYSDQATIVAEGTVVGTEGVIISIADNGSVTATATVVGNEGVIISIADSGSIGAPVTDITPDEGTILAYADNGTVAQTSAIVGTEGVIVGIADNGTLVATGTIIANEGTIIAVANNGAVTQITELVPNEGTIVGIADSGTITGTSTVVGNEGVIVGIADNGTVTATSIISGNEGVLVGVADNGAVVSTSIILGNEGVLVAIADNGTVVSPTPDNARITSTGGFRVTSDGDYRVSVAASGFTDGLSSFLSSYTGVHTAYSFNQTNANTGTDTTHDANSTTYATQTGFPNYGLASACNPDTSGDMDIYIITDAAMMLYIPAGLAHSTNYGLFHNGGGTNAQGGFLRATTTGVEIACLHNASGTPQDNVIHEIPDASLPGWFSVGFQFASSGGNQGDMALWINGVKERSGTRTTQLLYGSGNPQIGDSGADEPLQSATLDPSSYTGGNWPGEATINGSGLIIANFVADNPNNDNTSPAGNGDSFYTDYHTAHIT